MSLGSGRVAERETPLNVPTQPMWIRAGQRASALVARAVSTIPDRIPILTLWAAIAVSLSLIPGLFRPYIVIPLALLLWRVTWRFMPDRLPASLRVTVGSAVACEIVGGWVLVNRSYFSQQLSVYRDPAIYALRSWWLARHGSANIGIDNGTLAAVRTVSGAAVQSGGFPLIGHSLEPQGNTLVPGLLATAGWLGSPKLVLAANLVVGGVALLAVYALARRVVGPIWALGPLIALAGSMPMTVFSRSPYTEPTALLLIMVGMTALWAGWESGRRTLFTLAGVAIGASSLARIDGGVAALGGVAAIATVATLSTSSSRRAEARGHLIQFGLPATAGIWLGYLDLRLHSAQYLTALKSQLEPLMVGVPSLVVLAWATSRFLPLSRLRAGLSARASRVGRVAALLAAAGVVAMISRPLWLVTRSSQPAGNLQIAARQTAERLIVDSSRTYEENTITWLSWYFGWLMVLLAGAATAVIVYVVIRRRDPRLATFGIVVAVPALLYLNKASIFPDQVWAMRRYLPVVIPGMLIAGTWLVVCLHRRFPALQWLSVPVLVFAAVRPIATLSPMFTDVQGAGQLSEVAAICAQVGADKVVVIGRPQLAGSHLPTIQIVCGTKAIALPKASAGDLASIANAWGGRVKVVAFTSDAVPWAAGQHPAPIFAGSYSLWEESLVHPPRKGSATVPVSVWVGDIAAGGLVSPVVG